MRSDRRQSPARQPSARHVAVVGEGPGGSFRTHHSVFRANPAENGESSGVREVLDRGSDDEPASPPHGGGAVLHRRPRRDYELPKAVSISGILRGHTPAISADTEMKIWS